MSKILVIADSHLTPKKPAEYLWAALGRYCLKTRPDYIVHLGDVADFDSQAWLIKNRGKYTLEEEISQVRSCLEAFHKPLIDFNNTQRIMKKKMYKPSMVLTLGNHDVRNNMTDVADLFESFNWLVVDYLHPIQIEGITFVHCMAKGISDSFCTTSQELIENWHGNIVVGHGHHKDFFESYSMATKEKITALRSPAFTVDESDWAVQTQYKWSRGFTEIVTNPFTFIWRDCECLLKNS